jgi:hypothetical protein
MFLYRGLKPTSNFFCANVDFGLFQNAITAWKNTCCPQPVCHGHKKLSKMLVVKEKMNKGLLDLFSFAQIWVIHACSFWLWGDVVRPICYHGLQCLTQKVKRKKSQVYFKTHQKLIANNIMTL